MPRKLKKVDPVDRACRWHDEATACRDQGIYRQAQRLGEKALALLERELGPDHPDVANVLNHLGRVQSDLGNYSGAAQLHQRAVGIMEKLEEAGDLTRLRVQSLNDLGSLFRIQGRYPEAEAVLRRALGVAQKAKDRLEMASVLNNLAVVYKYENRFGEAKRLYGR